MSLTPFFIPQVGGLLLLRFNLISPPTNLVIFAIKVKINQHFTIHSAIDPEHVAYPPADARTVMVLDASHPPNFAHIEGPLPASHSGYQTPRLGPLKILRPEEQYKIHHLARLPNDNILRPSTQEWSESAIRTKHDIALEVTYRKLSEEEVISGIKSREKDEKGKERVKDRKKLVVSKPFEIFSVCFLALPSQR